MLATEKNNNKKKENPNKPVFIFMLIQNETLFSYFFLSFNILWSLLTLVPKYSTEQIILIRLLKFSFQEKYKRKENTPSSCVRVLNTVIVITSYSSECNLSFNKRSRKIFYISSPQMFFLRLFH